MLFEGVQYFTSCVQCPPPVEAAQVNLSGINREQINLISLDSRVLLLCMCDVYDFLVVIHIYKSTIWNYVCLWRMHITSSII